MLIPCFASAVALALRAPAPVMQITVCNGGTCTENGAEALLDAITFLSASDEKLHKIRGGGVRTAMCSGECPGNGAILCPKRGMVASYVAPCKMADEVLESAEAALAAAKVKGVEDLKAVFLSFREAQETGSLDAYAEALRMTPEALFAPSQMELPDEPLEWDQSIWVESLSGGDLAMGESTATFEYACSNAEDGSSLQLLDVTADDEAGTLSGIWEDGDSAAGSFMITMAANGRRFDGTLTDDADASERPWSGTRKRTGRRGEAPSARIAWLHDLLLSASRARLEAGDAPGAVGAAAQATDLCCQTASGWVALSEARDAAGDAEGAKAARDEAEWLR